MKHIKTYEKMYNKLKNLSDYLLLFLSEKTKLNLIFTNNNAQTDYTFWYISTTVQRKAMFEIYNIDYYTGDEDLFFKIKLDIGMIKNEKYVPKELSDAVDFIFYQMKNYYNNEEKIKMSDINNIINDINISNYQIYTKAKNYNL